MCKHLFFNGTNIYIEPLNADIDLDNSIYKELPDRLDSITSPKRKREIIMAHLMVRKHISDDALICHTQHGAPFIKDFDGHISISHSTTHIALAINNFHPIGIDIENWRTQLISVKTRFLSPKEADTYTSPKQLLQAWTAKEALYKIAQSPGITLNNDISLPIGDNHSNNIATVKKPNGISSFSIHHLISTPEQCITLAHPTIDNLL